MRHQAGLLLAACLLLLALACETVTVTPPRTPEASQIITPSETAALTASVAASVTRSPTSSIVEVTAANVTATATPSIVEVGTLPPIEAGVPVEQPGTYTPYSQLPVRACESEVCPITGAAGKRMPFNVDGWVTNEKGEWWICIEIHEDAHGATLCIGAVLWRSADGVYSGEFKAS